MALPDRIKVSMEFMQPNGLKQWLTSEHPIVPEEDVIEEFKSSKALLVAAFKSMNPGLDISIDYSAGWTETRVPISQVERNPKEAAINSQIEAINGCTSMKSLEIFKKLVEREKNDRLTEAYIARLNKL